MTEIQLGFCEGECYKTIQLRNHKDDITLRQVLKQNVYLHKGKFLCYDCRNDAFDAEASAWN